MSNIPVIGFTGTRGKLTNFQQERLLELLVSFYDDLGSREFHHGDCTGSDALAHTLALRAGYTKIHIHPPSDPKHRAYCHKIVAPLNTYELHPEAPYLVRNRHIINASDLVIATPSGPEVMRSGTWSTVRYARQRLRSIYVIYPLYSFLEYDSDAPSQD